MNKIVHEKHLMVDPLDIENSSLNDAQRTKGRCGESQENNVWIKWKYE